MSTPGPADLADFCYRLRALARAAGDSSDPIVLRCSIVLLHLLGVLASKDIGRLNAICDMAHRSSVEALAELTGEADA